MNNGDKAAMPQYGKFDADSSGLTKREYFAALAMQGFCAAPEFAATDVDGLAEAAVRQADALLAALEQPHD